jgi:hypothetical protein
MTVDYADWQAPQAHATAISVTGVPLLTGKSLVFSSGPQSIAASGTYVPGTKSFTQPGYEMFFSVFANAASATPYVTAELAWTDSGTGLIIQRDTYVLVAGSTVSGWISQITGPTKADGVFITITNLDTAHTMVFSMIILQNSRIYTHDSYMWDNTANAGNTVPGETLPNLPGDNSSLGWTTTGLIPANGNQSFLCAPGYSGWINLSVIWTTTPIASLSLTVFPQPNSYYGGFAHALQKIPVAVRDTFQFLAPRAPLHVRVDNSSATAGTWGFAMTLNQ